MHENIRSFGIFFYEFHSFASELSRAADVIVLSETWFSANTRHGIQGYIGIHPYRADKTEGGMYLSVYQKFLHIDPYGQFFSVSCIL